MKSPVIRPVSSRSRSAPTTIATTNIKVPVTACDWLGLNQCAQARTRTPPCDAEAGPGADGEEKLSDLLAGRRMPGDHRVEDDDAKRCAERVGERPLPLQDRVDRLRGRMKLSSGPTTVGPETTSTAPRTSATSQARSKSRWAATVPTAQVTRIPRLTSRR